MKLRFDSNLEFQKEAIAAVTDLFEGQPKISTHHFSIHDADARTLFDATMGTGNALYLEDDRITKNLRTVQERHRIVDDHPYPGRDFSIEMETGTGKTYVYLRTIFELHQRYGWKKFIIVVPSVAIREGVRKSIDITQDHFQRLYGNQPLNHFIYDSRKLGRVSNFARGKGIRIMIINIQSFLKDIDDREGPSEEDRRKINVIHRHNDTMQGERPIALIQASQPIVIIDEPQSVDNTEKAKRAIENLNPMFVLRYSATHRDLRNPVYRLGPVEAREQELVKKIELLSVTTEQEGGIGYLKLIRTDNSDGLKAQLRFYRSSRKDMPKAVTLWLRTGDNLFEKSKRNPDYARGYTLRDIDCTPGKESVTLSRGAILKPGEEIGGFQDEISTIQIEKTIETHLEKEKLLRRQGIKVLSLFFIDRVADYRRHRDGGAPGPLARIFEDTFRRLTRKKEYRGIIDDPVESVHDGYFSADQRGSLKDTSGKTQADSTTYDLIMRDKEKLLDLHHPLRFIFSHSALREGWDNPNVFQICTLRRVSGAIERRQQIGRGLRLAVDRNGNRIRERHVNRLTVIADEYYQDFLDNLQEEYEADGIIFGRVTMKDFADIRENDRPVGIKKAKGIWQDMHRRGYIDPAGRVLEAFDMEGTPFQCDERFQAIRWGIHDCLRRCAPTRHITRAEERRALQLNKDVYLSEEFRHFWSLINNRTRYYLNFDQSEVIPLALRHIKSMPAIEPPPIVVRKGTLTPTARRVESHIEREEVHTTALPPVLPDILSHLQQETGLTRKTLAGILCKSQRLMEFVRNPQRFQTQITNALRAAMIDLFVQGIQYRKIKKEKIGSSPSYHSIHDSWEMERISEEVQRGITRYVKDLVILENNKSPLHPIPCDSLVEREYAASLDQDPNVKFFLKLPRWFRVDTPVGEYNPDWAVYFDDKKNYCLIALIRENKSPSDNAKWRWIEKAKTLCGEKHFQAVRVDYRVENRWKAPK